MNPCCGRSPPQDKLVPEARTLAIARGEHKVHVMAIADGRRDMRALLERRPLRAQAPH